MNLAMLGVARARKPRQCRLPLCEREIEPGTIYAAVTRRTRTKKYITHAFHDTCLIIWMTYRQTKNEQKVREGNTGGARTKQAARLAELTPKAKKRRRHLLIYVNTLYRKKLEDAYKADDEDRANHIKKVMAPHVAELYNFGIPWGLWETSQNIRILMRDKDPMFFSRLVSAKTHEERVGAFLVDTPLS